MYIDKLHFDHDNVHLTIDTRTGEFLEIYTRKNGDNLIKNLMEDVPQPFVLSVKTGNDVKKYTPLPIHVAAGNPATHVKIEQTEEKGGLLVTVKYSSLWDGEKITSANVSYSALLLGDEITFSIQVQNEYENSKLSEVQFPVIPGVWLGESYEDDTLVYPLNAGIKVENPVHFFGKPLKYIDWRWQEYKYRYYIDSPFVPHPRFAAYQRNGFSGRYANGGICMSWFDLYDNDGGVYFACHDPSMKTCILDVSAVGDRRPGLIFQLAYEPYAQYGETYSSPPAKLYFHEGDWHKGAKRYRAFKQPLIEKFSNTQPSWFKDSAALVAHYDFKYQNGNVVHTYKDIPELAKQAKEMGSDHLLLSGWHKGGFDNGYPLYFADPDMGTEEELAQAIEQAKAMGVHTTFYINMRLHNGTVDPDRVKDKAIMFENGNYKYSYWGNTKDVEFYDMCPGSELWQQEICSIAEHATDAYGIEGIYFDVLSVGASLCFNPKHRHHHDSFSESNLKILQNIRKHHDEKHEEPLLLMGEHVCDMVGGVMSMQLNQVFFTYHQGGFPNMYRYTFPEHPIVDMLYPSKNMFMRPVHVAKKWQHLMAMLFTNGSYFWVYDLVGDNSFTRDQEGMELLKKLIALRKIMLQKGKDHLFSDEDGITCNTPNVIVKRFIHQTQENRSMLAVFRLSDAEARVRLDFTVNSAVAIYYDGKTQALAINNGELIIPQDKICLILLNND